MITRSITTTSALSILLAIGCSSGPSAPPAEELARATKEARQELELLKARDVVVTPDKVSQLIGPLDSASTRFVEELEAWGTGSVDPEYIKSQMPYVNAAFADLRAFLTEFGIELDAADPTKLPDNQNTEYWKRWLCYAVVAGGTAGCAALCTALLETGVGYAACMAACGSFGNAGIRDCAKITCWSGDGSGAETCPSPSATPSPSASPSPSP